MTFFGSAKVIAFLLATSFVSTDKIPSVLLGNWKIGRPFDAHQPVGLNALQEKYIESLHLRYTPERIQVCGKEIEITSLKSESLTSDAFLEKFGFLPNIIGLKSSTITEVNINLPRSMDACGQYEDPGVHVFIGDGEHIVMEVANDYFPLIKRRETGER